MPDKMQAVRGFTELANGGGRYSNLAREVVLLEWCWRAQAMRVLGLGRAVKGSQGAR